MNSTNPNRGHYHPAPIIDRGPKRPAPDNAGQDSKSGSKGKGGRS